MGIKRATRNSPFFLQFKIKTQQKLLITTFLLVQENLKDIVNRGQNDFFSVLHLLEGDANCSISTKYVSKPAKDFPEEPLEKNCNSEVLCFPPPVDFFGGIF